MVQKRAVRQKKSKASKTLPVVGLLVGIALIAGIFFAASKEQQLHASDLILAKNETLVDWVNTTAYGVTLQEEGFVSGRVEQKTRSGDPSIAPTLIGAYTFKTESDAELFYNDLLKRDLFFSNQNLSIDASVSDASCDGYAVKQQISPILPPINSIHVICQKEYTVIEILLRTYKIDGPQVATRIAYLMLRKI